MAQGSVSGRIGSVEIIAVIEAVVMPLIDLVRRISFVLLVV